MASIVRRAFCIIERSVVSPREIPRDIFVEMHGYFLSVKHIYIFVENWIKHESATTDELLMREKIGVCVRTHKFRADCRLKN